MNLNKIAVEISKLEAGKYEMSIAQIKECLKNTLFVIGMYNNREIIRTVQRYRKLWLKQKR